MVYFSYSIFLKGLQLELFQLLVLYYLFIYFIIDFIYFFNLITGIDTKIDYHKK